MPVTIEDDTVYEAICEVAKKHGFKHAPPIN